jgi:Lrp/AsnC family leucine-responsive transcriptional regulator
VLERVRKLEKRGIVEGYQARLSARSLGFQLLAYIYVKTDESMSKMSTGETLSRIPEVQEVHHVAGEDCYLVKVRTESPESLGRLLRNAIGQIPTVLSTRSTIVLETIKEDFTLPLERMPNHEES